MPFVGAATTAGKIAKKVKKGVDKAKGQEGVYDLVIKKGEDIKGYIGQSKNLVDRINKHFGTREKLKEFVKIGDEILYKMPGSTKK